MLSTSKFKLKKKKKSLSSKSRFGSVYLSGFSLFLPFYPGNFLLLYQLFDNYYIPPKYFLQPFFFRVWVIHVYGVDRRRWAWKPGPSLQEIEICTLFEKFKNFFLKKHSQKFIFIRLFWVYLITCLICYLSHHENPKIIIFNLFGFGEGRSQTYNIYKGRVKLHKRSILANWCSFWGHLQILFP